MLAKRLMSTDLRVIIQSATPPMKIIHKDLWYNTQDLGVYSFHITDKVWRCANRSISMPNGTVHIDIFKGAMYRLDKGDWKEMKLSYPVLSPSKPTMPW